MNPIRKRAALRRASKFISQFEGGQSSDGKFHAYWDPYGKVMTQGYGHTRTGITTKPWSKRKALRVLAQDAKFVIPYILEATDLKLRAHELAALISFAFNLGPGYFERGHTIGDALHRNSRPAIAAAFPLYDQADGQHLAGLTRRRLAERRLFLGH